MAQYRRVNYSRYRGRTPKWKVALAVVLVLVILFSGGLILMQGHLIFDSDGHARLEMPWGTDEPEHEALEVPELDIQEPVSSAVPRRAQVLPDMPLTLAGWTAAQQAADGLDQAAVTLRQNGRVGFNSDAAPYQAMNPAADTMEALAKVTESCTPAICLFSCFLDPVVSQVELETMGLQNTGGYIFYDGGNRNWLDPAKPETVAYLSKLLTECAALGFDELVLRDFTFPTEGKLDKIAYTKDVTQTEALNQALTAFRTALDEAGYQTVALSVELSPDDILAGENQTAGVSLAALANTADAIYARTELDKVPALMAAVEAAGSACFVPILPELPPQEVQPESFLVEPS